MGDVPLREVRDVRDVGEHPLSEVRVVSDPPVTEVGELPLSEVRDVKELPAEDEPAGKFEL